MVVSKEMDAVDVLAGGRVYVVVARQQSGTSVTVRRMPPGPSVPSVTVLQRDS